ncbi:hypothetical protein LRP50_13775 [Enterovibrio sp. ZSDZ42]|uniref:Uncharacterized protein n=1 Tax=Enterovibrio gelatinilyticus TaxID=2899819 RepID=A0ABT5R220_9GAMM|nr:hypothetical protein [Enterovibrio sp. ZSDZ42]MDD1794205.1 hypothetical protein [Enterovibrio sp. ZSDZ42]
MRIALPLLIWLASFIALADDFKDQISFSEYQTTSIPMNSEEHWDYVTRYDIPLTLDAVSNYTSRYGLETIIRERTIQNNSGGCGHSPACAILLPFYLIDMMLTTEVKVDEVIFYQNNVRLFHVQYSKPDGVLITIEFNSVTTRTSHLLRKTVIGLNQNSLIDLSNEIMSQLPNLKTEAHLEQFTDDLSGLSYRGSNTELERAQLDKTSNLLKSETLSEPQLMALFTRWCDIINASNEHADKAYSPLNLVPYSSGISQGIHATELLDCIIDSKEKSASEETAHSDHPSSGAISPKIQKDIDRLVELQEQALTQLASFQPQKWTNLTEQFFKTYLPLKSEPVLTTSHQLLHIYKGWFLNGHISTADYIVLAQAYPEISAPLRDQLSVKHSNVLDARLALIKDGIYPPLATLTEMKESQIRITDSVAKTLSVLYWQSHYPNESFLYFSRQDKDLEKQAYILYFLNPLPLQLRQSLPFENGDTDGHLAWKVAILDKEIEGLAGNLYQRPRSDDSSPDTPENTSNRVDEQGNAHFSDLIWYALSFHPEKEQKISHLVEMAKAKEKEEEEEESWLNRGHNLLENL